ncbi:GNAT family N-acetyltransferase [Candidatus Kaiserbacteria bacterium]|nr:GNAT family N-acetyltransferase [Candidatus Kaiserbacteria bacterium]
MKTRKASLKDFPAIRALIKAFPDKLLQDHLPPIGSFFVAIEDTQIVGCCALEIYSKRLAEIRTLAVAKEYQGRGIASELVAKCLADAKKKRVYEVLSITGAVALFEKQGFGTFNKEKYALLKILG